MIARFIQDLRENKLTASACKLCTLKYFPPRAICSKCMKETTTIQLSNRGKIITFSEVYVSTGKTPTPYVVAIAEIDGLKIPAIILDVRYEEIRIGDEIEVVFMKNIHGLGSPEYWYYFKLAKRENNQKY